MVVDNCEHVIEDVAELLDALLERCPRLRVLATSRESLEIDGEHTWKVPSLATGADSAGVQLFVDRATAAGSVITLDAASLGIIGDIVERLDGIPLAIELASGSRSQRRTCRAAAIVSTIGSGSSPAASADPANGRRRSKPQCSGRTTC